MEEFVVNYGISGAIILILIAAGIAILFGIIQSIFNPKQALKSIVGIAILAAIIFGIYSIAPSEITETFKGSKYKELGVTPAVMKYSYTAIVASIILIGIAFVSWIVLELINLVR